MEKRKKGKETGREQQIHVPQRPSGAAKCLAKIKGCLLHVPAHFLSTSSFRLPRVSTSHIPSNEIPTHKCFLAMIGLTRHLVCVVSSIHISETGDPAWTHVSRQSRFK